MTIDMNTDRLYLRHLQLSDAEGNYPHWFNDKSVTRYNSHGERHYTKEMAIKYIQSVICNDTTEVFAIILKENNQHIGNISLQNIDFKNRNAEFAILIGETQAYSKGIGFEASVLVFNYGFNDLNLHRIYCGTSCKNIPMQKLALKLGMTQEGIKREAMLKNAQFIDIIEYAILKEEFILSF
jgi:RimJ/RimL family protein N-acetyltransferase